MAVLRRKLAMSEHLRQLSYLMSREVEESELLPPKEAKRIREILTETPREPDGTFEISFQDKQSSDFKAYLSGLTNANPSPVQVWVSTTIECGILVAPSLQAISWDFGFAANADGILSLLTADLNDSLLLDFGEDDRRVARLTVDVYGRNWGSVPFPFQSAGQGPRA